jgi:uncharacterized membrane protein YdjX (TVP38/TMEM64 family)
MRIAIPLVLIGAFIAGAWRLGYFRLERGNALQQAAAQVDDIPWLAPAFILAYAIVATFAAPVSPLAYGAGVLFGVIRGSTYVLIASLIGAAAGYWLARGAWSGTAHRLLARYDHQLDKLRDGNAFLTTLRLQILPILPFGIFNYAAGVAGLRFLPFLAGTFLGIIPGTIAAVYVGERIAAGFRGSGKTAFLVALLVMLGVVGLSFVPAALKRLRTRKAHRH